MYIIDILTDTLFHIFYVLKVYYKYHTVITMHLKIK